jgi:hypothetical protein
MAIFQEHGTESSRRKAAVVVAASIDLAKKPVMDTPIKKLPSAKNPTFLSSKNVWRAETAARSNRKPR